MEKILDFTNNVVVVVEVPGISTKNDLNIECCLSSDKQVKLTIKAKYPSLDRIYSCKFSHSQQVKLTTTPDYSLEFGILKVVLEKNIFVEIKKK